MGNGRGVSVPVANFTKRVAVLGIAMSSTIRPTESPVESPAEQAVSHASLASSHVAPSPASRIAAISAEIPLEIHGSRKSPTDGHPVEAFHEDTVSVIVFPKGGIVRLAAGVSKGQMIAVTNLNTQRGMLCRVANVRTYPNLKNYVEVEFTQPAAGFWGVNFPQDASSPAQAPAAPPPEQAAQPPAPEAKKESASPKANPPAQHAPEIAASHPITDEPNLVHVSSDDETAAIEIASASKPADLKPEDFWGTSFPTEMMETPAAPRISSEPAAAPVPPARKTKSSKSAAVAPKANPENAEPIELAIDGDETWSELLSQLPTRPEKPIPPRPLEISDEEFHLESNVPGSEAPVRPATVAEAQVAKASPPESAIPKFVPPDPQVISPAPHENYNPASPATLKELERLALGHLDVNQDQPLAQRAPKIPERTKKSKRVATVPVSPELASPDHANLDRSSEHRPASSAAALHSFTSASGGSVQESAQSVLPGSEKLSFGNFLKDPEPRSSAQRVFSEHSDVMTASLLAPTAPLHAAQASRSGSGFFLAAAAIVILGAGGGWFFLQNMTNAPAKPAVVGKPWAEQTPLPPGNLKPNAEPYETANHGAEITSSPSPANANSSSGTPETGLEVELTTAVTPPAKNGTGPEPAATSQPKPAGKRTSIPPLNLSAPTSNDDGPSSTNVEPPPEVSGRSAAASNGDAFNKIGANTSSNIPRPTVSNPAPVVPSGGDVKQPHLIWSEAPVYPVLAKQANIQGDVKIDATIDPSGHVAKMKIISGPMLLQQAAMTAVRQWKYAPSTLDGKPVSSQLVITVEFRR
ncbi:MAG: TonB family protein [Candidatus Acidiferrales bacterium]|jgi:TonB family protein